MLLEELAGFQSRLEGRPISTEEAMRLTIEQLVNSLFPVRVAAFLEGSPLLMGLVPRAVLGQPSCLHHAVQLDCRTSNAHPPLATLICFRHCSARVPVLQRYIATLKELLERCRADSNSPAGQQICALVNLRVRQPPCVSLSWQSGCDQGAVRLSYVRERAPASHRDAF